MKYSYKCQSCGANIMMDSDNMQLFCQFCGSSLPDASEIIKKSMELSDKESERQHQLKKQKIETKSTDHAITSIIVLSCFGFAVILALIIFCFSALKH